MVRKKKEYQYHFGPKIIQLNCSAVVSIFLFFCCSLTCWTGTGWYFQFLAIFTHL